jgi:NADP-dependent 3-hydroxy acid dehydrogenase YdfG
MNTRFDGIEIQSAQDIAQTITFVVTRPWRMAINEVLIRPTEQDG